MEYKFYAFSHQAWDDMLLSCEGAKKKIYMEHFVFVDTGPGEIGRRFMDVFLKKAKEGVEIKMIIDGIGSHDFFLSTARTELEDAGIQIFFHLTPPFEHIRRLHSFFARTHSKLLLIDDRAAFVGGVIVREKAKFWRDTAVRLTGEECGIFSRVFWDFWETLQTGKDLMKTIIYNCSNFDAIRSTPKERRRGLYNYLLRELLKAEKSVYVITPYFSPPPRFVRMFKQLARKGLRVKFLFTGVSDNFLAQWATRSHFTELLKAGTEIYFYKNVVMHAKLIIIDEKWTTLGSNNFDRWGFWSSYELNISVNNENFTKELIDQLDRDVLNSHRILYDEWKKRAFKEKFFDFFGSFLRPFV